LATNLITINNSVFQFVQMAHIIPYFQHRYDI